MYASEQLHSWGLNQTFIGILYKGTSLHAYWNDKDFLRHVLKVRVVMLDGES
jgi:hypothetical protein